MCRSRFAVPRVVGAAFAAALAPLSAAGTARASSDVGVGSPAGGELAKCEALTAQGRKAEAIELCGRVWRDQRTPEAGRALVRARMSGPGAPTLTDLSAGLSVASHVRKTFPASPWGYVAMCDVAETIGDDVMLQECSKDLQRVAPGDLETERAASATRALRPSWLVWAGWIAIFTSTAAAIAESLLQAVRRRTSAKRAVLVVVAALLGIVSVERAVLAGDGVTQISKFAVDEANPAASVPTEEQRNKNPVEFGYWLMDLAEKALRASKRGDHQAAIRYYSAMTKAVPDRPVGFLHLCDEYEAAGDREQAIKSCGTALYLQPVRGDDFIHYLRLVIGKPGDLNDKEVAAAASVIKHLHEDPTMHDLGDTWECQLAVRIRNADLLQACSSAMAAKAPQAPTTILYQWTLALMRGQLDEATRLSGLAKTAGMDPVAVARLDRDTAALGSQHGHKLWLGVGAAFLAFIALVALGVWVRMRGKEAGDVAKPVAEEPAPAAGA